MKLPAQITRPLIARPLSRRLFQAATFPAVILMAHTVFSQTTIWTSGSNGAAAIGAPGSSTVATLTVSPSATGEIAWSDSLTFNGAPIANGNGGNNFTFNSAKGNDIAEFSALTINGGAVRMNITANDGGSTRLVFDRLVIKEGGWLVIPRSILTPGMAAIASQMSSTASIVFNTPPVLSTSGTGTGTQTGVVVGAIVGGVNSRGMATYDSTHGLRALTDSETAALAGGMKPDQNATVSGNATIGADTRVNSLDNSTSLGGIIALGKFSTLTVSSGMMHFAQSYVIGSISNRGTLAFGASRGYIYADNSRTVRINSVITGSGGLSVYADDLNGHVANVILAGDNTFTGTTTIASNRRGKTVLNLYGSLALQGSTLDYDNGGGISFNNSLTAFTLGGLQGAQNLDLTNDASAAVALSIGNNNTSTTYSGILSGAGSITKIGGGTLTLAGANTFTGATRISGGTLALSDSGVLASTSLIFDIANTGAGRLSLTNTSGCINGAGAFTGALVINLAGVTASGSATLFTGPGFTAGSLALAGIGSDIPGLVWTQSGGVWSTSGSSLISARFDQSIGVLTYTYTPAVPDPSAYATMLSRDQSPIKGPFRLVRF